MSPFSLSDTFCCAKLLCFTRSSPIIHQFVLEDSNFKICKLSLVQSQTVVHEILEDFITSSHQKIFLLIANMQVSEY